MSSSTGPRHLCLVGPTASGKTALALALAGDPDVGPVELVSADSMLVYRGMDIGTAKPSPEERTHVPHHVVDVADPSEEYHLARFQSEVGEALTGIEARGHRAVLVGGTGLYVRSVVDGLTVPPPFPAIRSELEAQADAVGPEALHARLAELDPLAASRMEPGNRRRIVRALEVTLGSGRPFSSFGPGLDAYGPPAIDVQLVGIRWPTEALRHRIEARVHAMVAAGLVAEVAELAGRPGGLSRTARQALGYKEILAHLEGGLPLADAVELVVRRTRQFARRQRVWFERDPRIRWLEPAEEADGNWIPGTLRQLRDWWPT